MQICKWFPNSLIAERFFKKFVLCATRKVLHEFVKTFRKHQMQHEIKKIDNSTLTKPNKAISSIFV